jgi:hypothetical protein
VQADRYGLQRAGRLGHLRIVISFLTVPLGGLIALIGSIVRKNKGPASALHAPRKISGRISHRSPLRDDDVFLLSPEYW